jgi:hypothetical protein
MTDYAMSYKIIGVNKKCLKEHISRKSAAGYVYMDFAPGCPHLMDERCLRAAGSVGGIN